MIELIGKAHAQFRILPSGDPTTWTIDNIWHGTNDNNIITNITELALLIAGGIAVIFLIIGAFSYLTAYGDEEKANTGKKTITWAIVGIIVIILAEVISGWIFGFFDTSSPTPTTIGQVQTSSPVNNNTQIQDYLKNKLNNLTNEQLVNIGKEVINKLPPDAKKEYEKYFNNKDLQSLDQDQLALIGSQAVGQLNEMNAITETDTQAPNENYLQMQYYLQNMASGQFNSLSNQIVRQLPGELQGYGYQAINNLQNQIFSELNNAFNGQYNSNGNNKQYDDSINNKTYYNTKYYDNYQDYTDFNIYDYI